MDGNVRLAALNNVDWCETVCRAHGIATETSPRLWFARSRTPRFYPDAVTLSPRAGAREVLAGIERGAGASVKDSFATLDLDAHGFTVLLEAQWLFRGPGPPEGGHELELATVRTAAGLRAWIGAAGLGGVLTPQLLRDPSVRVLTALVNEEPRAGALLNRSSACVGVSNVFAESVAPDAVWRAVTRTATTLFPGSALVGYERGDALDGALDAGFAPLAPLRIWSRP